MLRIRLTQVDFRFLFIRLGRFKITIYQNNLISPLSKRNEVHSASQAFRLPKQPEAVSEANTGLRT